MNGIAAYVAVHSGHVGMRIEKQFHQRRRGQQHGQMKICEFGKQS
jgi:hypothetical protein